MKLKEFEGMCRKAGIKREALCDTVFTRQFKKEGEDKDGTKEETKGNLDRYRELSESRE